MTTTEETWNTCPKCGGKWRDEEPTSGLIHRTRLCFDCAHPSPDGIPLLLAELVARGELEEMERGPQGQRQYRVTPAGMAATEARIREAVGDRSVLP